MVRFNLVQISCGNKFVTALLLSLLWALPTWARPAINYATILNGDNTTLAEIGSDAAGNIYLIGVTDDAALPITASAYQRSYRGNGDIFVAKIAAGIDANGQDFSYLTYIGGSFREQIESAYVDARGNVYIAGQTSSADFPITPDALELIAYDDPAKFVVKLNPTGSKLVYSTYFNHAERIVIAADANGNAYLSGETRSIRLPVSSNAFQRKAPKRKVYSSPSNAFVTKLNATGTNIVYSTYLGGELKKYRSTNEEDRALAIAVDAQGFAYVTGYTNSPDFPVTADAYDKRARSIFVTKFNQDGSGLVYSTYLGGKSVDLSNSIAVDARGAAYICGSSNSSDYPISAGALQIIRNGSGYARFVTKIEPDGGSLGYSTLIGETNPDSFHGPMRIAVDAGGNAHLAGISFSGYYPLTVDAFRRAGSAQIPEGDLFYSKLNNDGSRLHFSTLLGGSAAETNALLALDSNGGVYLGGNTRSQDFPVTDGSRPKQMNWDWQGAFLTSLQYPAPRISAAVIENGQLKVTGENFDNGARIIVNGRPLKTMLDTATTLTSTRAVKQIAIGATAKLQVANSDGLISREFTFTRN